MKSAFVAIVGRPSSGKSTLINALCGHKVSIVSPVPQTTRNRIRGIVNRPEGQVVFLDTPGIHLSQKKFNEAMMSTVHESLKDADVILYLADSTRIPGPEELAIAQRLKKFEKPTIAVLNKTDQKNLHTPEFLLFIQKELAPKNIIKISALQQTGLEKLLSEVFLWANEGPAYYPEDFYTDQSPDFRVAEVIREQAINRVKDELPHAIYVEVEDLEIKDAENQMWIRAVIHVERHSQIGILVGHGGTQIKEIRQSSQKELGKIFTQRIHLDLRVKASPKWRQSDHLIQKLLDPEDLQD